MKLSFKQVAFLLLVILVMLVPAIIKLSIKDVDMWLFIVMLIISAFLSIVLLKVYKNKFEIQGAATEPYFSKKSMNILNIVYLIILLAMLLFSFTY